MRMFLRPVVAFSAVCLLQAVSPAGTLMVAGSGMFSNSAPTTAYSAPNTAWSFSFNVPDVPAVTNSDSIGFDVPFTNFTYQLGIANVATTPARIRFFDGGIGGLFNIDIVDTSSPPAGNPATGFEFSGAQAFSGTTSNPTILTGPYPTTAPTNFFSGDLLVDSFSGATISITESSTATPEPATFAMAAVAGCLFGWMRRRQGVR